MKKGKFLLYLFLAVLVFSGCALKKNDNQSKMDIYLLMGQSNMAGRGKLSSVEVAPNQKVLMLTKDLQWVPAKNPVHFDKPTMAGVGPGLAFGGVMQQSLKKQVGLVPTAVGGTSIDSWVPGGYDKATKKYPFDDAKERIIKAMQYGTIRGVIWHQGEADSDPEGAAVYLSKLEKLIERVRALTKSPNLPFVAGELGRFKANAANINDKLKQLPALVPYTRVVSSDGLSHKGDQLHFDAASANLLGLRFAEQMIKLQEQK